MCFKYCSTTSQIPTYVFDINQRLSLINVIINEPGGKPGTLARFVLMACCHRDIISDLLRK